MRAIPEPILGSEDAESAKVLPLRGGVTATVSRDEDKGWVFLSITDATGGVDLTLKVPAREASDLAVLLVNAANGL